MVRHKTAGLAALIQITAFISGASAQSGVYTLTDSTTTTIYTVTQDTGGDIPLASKKFNYPNLPYKADSSDGPRGRQQGYNICNSTTLGPDSWCQTGFVNSIEDFCIWGAPLPNVTVAEDEEQLVAYCTTASHGTRVIPPGALQGVQFITTPDYVEVVGYIDQTALNLQADDYGGEEDPHGADQRGNPLGALMYSSAFSSNGSGGGSSEYTQAIEWSYFVGSGVFCFKVCDPSSARDAALCQHTYDRVGCTYNAPASYATINGTFTDCKGDNQLPVGQYLSQGNNGQTKTYTWTQPPESLGVIQSIPYSPVPPPTSQCSTFESSSLYTDLASYYSANPIVDNSTTMATTTAAATTAGEGGNATTTVATAPLTSNVASAAQTAVATNSPSAAVVSAAATGIVRKKRARNGIIFSGGRNA